MIAHVVLFTPRPDLTLEEQRALADAFGRATRAIPAVRRVRLGRLVRHGAGYERAEEAAPAFVAMLEFDDLAGLQAYLAHPAHEGLGPRLRGSVRSLAVYDFEVGGVEFLESIG
jgi:hypothetical protein